MSTFLGNVMRMLETNKFVSEQQVELLPIERWSSRSNLCHNSNRKKVQHRNLNIKNSWLVVQVSMSASFSSNDVQVDRTFVAKCASFANV